MYSYGGKDKCHYAPGNDFASGQYQKERLPPYFETPICIYH